ncbi:ABC transporter ATP-binding protein [Xylanimonas ulmi]
MRYGLAEAFRDVSLRVDDAQIVALLGNNGAGKTTLVRALSGTLARHGGRVVAGSARGAGLDLTRARADAIVRAGVVQVPEGRRIFGQLSVDENLAAGALALRSRAEARRIKAWVLDLFPVLAAKAGHPAALLSGGEQQMLAIGRALMSGPRTLLLDEPSLGIAPLATRTIMDTVREVNRAGASVLLVEQNTRLALSVAHHACLLHGGTIRAEGPAADLAASDVILELTLGRGVAHTATAAAVARGGGDG